MSDDRNVRITLVRHGESVSNVVQLWQGQGDSPLSERGRAQARALAERLHTRSFDRIVASDLARASDTAAALGRPFERDARFRELDVGAWEGLTRHEVATRFADELSRLEAGEDVALGGGESYARFCERVDVALAALRETLAPGEHALVVCHGGVIGALLSGLLGLRGARMLPIGRVLNAGLTEIELDAAGRPTLHVLNDTLHLAARDLGPRPAEMISALGLVCERAPHARFGAFAAHYESDAAWLEGSSALDEVLARMRARHPDERVALSAQAARIHAWAMETLWREVGVTPGRLAPPPLGSICHVSAAGEWVGLLDYGVLPFD